MLVLCYLLYIGFKKSEKNMNVMKIIIMRVLSRSIERSKIRIEKGVSKRGFADFWWCFCWFSRPFSGSTTLPALGIYEEYHSLTIIFFSCPWSCQETTLQMRKYHIFFFTWQLFPESWLYPEYCVLWRIWTNEQGRCDVDLILIR